MIPLKTTVTLVLATLLAAPATHAVYEDASGLGQALVYPYYTARSAEGNAFNTYLSVVNTTADAKVVRVMFREGRAGRPVLQFNLYLSAKDMWTGAVVPAEGDATLLISADRSCTNPPFGAATPYSAAFSADRYVGAEGDNLGAGLERAREGYVEVIEMATLAGAASEAVRQGGNGIPANCAAVQGAPLPLEGQLAPPSGGLTGTLTLINVASGRDFTVNAEALAGLTTLPFYRNYDDAYPDFDAAEVAPVSHLVDGGTSYRLVWANGLQAVSSVLMAASVTNEFVLDAGTESSTEWVMTFPTRRLHAAGSRATPPFDDPFISRACQPALAARFDRSGRSWSEPYFDDLQPPPPPYTACHAASVARFEAGVGTKRPLTASTNLVSYNAGTTERVNVNFLEHGHADLLFRWPVGYTTHPVPGLSSLEGSSRTDLATGQTLEGRFRVEGLPVTGFMLRTFANGRLTCEAGGCQGNWGGAFPHRRTRSVRVLP